MTDQDQKHGQEATRAAALPGQQPEQQPIQQPGHKPGQPGRQPQHGTQQQPQLGGGGQQPQGGQERLLLIPTKFLMLIAGAIWIIAGAMVVMVGINATYQPWTAAVLLGSLLVLAAFLAMFLMISRQHAKRIMSYQKRLMPLYCFFDARSYIIMAVMIFLGASVRLAGFLPDAIIALFYCGLGAALIIAGIYLVVSYISVCDELQLR